MLVQFNRGLQTRSVQPGTRETSTDRTAYGIVMTSADHYPGCRTPLPILGAGLTGSDTNRRGVGSSCRSPFPPSALPGLCPRLPLALAAVALGVQHRTWTVRQPPRAARAICLSGASDLAALAKVLMTVRESSFGQMVLVGGEAGIGKTALLQRFCETLYPSVRLLRGSCDPLFAPPPLGPLLAIAEGLQGELKQIVRSGSAAHDVALLIFLTDSPAAHSGGSDGVANFVGAQEIGQCAGL